MYNWREGVTRRGQPGMQSMQTNKHADEWRNAAVKSMSVISGQNTRSSNHESYLQHRGKKRQLQKKSENNGLKEVMSSNLNPVLVSSLLLSM